MKSRLLLLLLALLAIQSQCLSHKIQSHLQATASQQAYFDKLNDLEKKLNTQIQNLDVLINSINKNISLYEGLTTIQTQALQAGLLLERQSLHKMGSQLVLPLQLKTWECQMLTQKQQEAIVQKINDAEKNIDLLQSKIQAESDCQKNQQIQSQISYLNFYLDHLSKQLNANCPATTPTNPTNNNTTPTVPVVPVTKIVRVPNSQNKNYVYGSQGQTAYNTNMQSLLNQGYVKQQCPVQAPFPTQDKCVSCAANQYFDLTSFKCLQCPADSIFDIKTRNCIIRKKNSNPQAPNYQGQVPNQDSSIDTCPIQKPFFDGKNCISCDGASYFSFKDNTCKTCMDNRVFDPVTKLCVYKRFNSNINKQSSNYCCGTVTNDPGIDTCPKQKPFFDGKQCIQCKMPGYFNLQTKTCVLCPEGQSYSLIKHNCIDIKYFQPVYRPDLKAGQNYIGTPTSYSQLYQNVQSCPSDRPFVSESSCIACKLPNYFNFQINKCQACFQNSQFDISSRKCIKISSQRMNNNMATLVYYMGKIPQFNPQLATCPGEKPFFNGKQCVSCVLPQYADFTSLRCQSCSTGYIYNIENRQCIVDPPKYYTDPEAQNIYYNGDYNIVLGYIKTIRSQNSNISKCPSDRPYYNAQTGICIRCEGQFPLFDYKFNRCINCTGISHYDPTQRICTTKGSVSPTVERMIMNTVGWT